MYLVDTCALSELRRPAPDVQVAQWFRERQPRSLYLSVVTLGEIRKGVEGLATGRRKRAIQEWLELDLPEYFSGRLLAVDAHTADLWGRVMARPRRQGGAVHAVDALLAATALQHGLTVVTRNLKDFDGLGVEVVNPWVGN